MRKKCSRGCEKLFKFKAEGREFAKIFRSLEQCFLTVGQNNFCNKIPFPSILFVQIGDSITACICFSKQHQVLISLYHII